MKFGHLILAKIFRFVATRCQISRLKCTKFNFDRGSPQTPMRKLIAPPDILARFKGPTTKWREGKDGEW